MDEPNLTHAAVRCQAGDKQSFRLIADIHGERLYGIAFLILNDRGRSEDAAQEVLVQAWRHIKRFRAGRKVQPVAQSHPVERDQEAGQACPASRNAH